MEDIKINKTTNLKVATDLEFKDWLADKLINAGYTPNEIELSYSLTLRKRVKALKRLQSLCKINLPKGRI